jgi:hypothetical protein
VTTGHGIALVASTLLALLSGTTTWTSAAPFLLAGVIGIVWPENTALETSAQSAASDVAGMVSAYGEAAVTSVPATKPQARKRPTA